MTFLKPRCWYRNWNQGFRFLSFWIENVSSKCEIRLSNYDCQYGGGDYTQGAILSQFQGKIQQIPPVFSAIRKNGKKLYEEAREGKTAEDLSIEPREVEIINLTCRPQNHMGESLPCFGLDVECGGGTYIRSLVRDMGLTLKTRATMTHLVRTRQGPFTLQDALKKEEWTPERIAEMIRSV